jgi:phospholipid/cholesterol/gamma-HCH transport system substrate-binding protein
MDKRIASNLIVGIFVLVGFGLFLFLVFTMGGNSGLFGGGITLYGRFAHIKGLHYGSEVSLSGLRVGTVKNIIIAPDATKELIVEMTIEKKNAGRIRKDSIAKIVTQGVLGDKYVEITIGSPEQPPEHDGDSIQTTEIEDLFTKSGSLVEDISKEFKGGDFDQLLKNLNRVAVNLATITAEVERGNGLAHELLNGTSGRKFDSAMTHLDSFMNRIDKGEGTLGGLISDPTIYEDLKNIVSGAKRSSILRYFMDSFRGEGQKENKK